jgi:hypothetical protein
MLALADLGFLLVNPDGQKIVSNVLDTVFWYVENLDG